MNNTSIYNQVLRFESFKSSDLAALEKELLDRIGTGNYEEERTKFNHEFTSFDSPLRNSIEAKLKENGVNYAIKKSDNLLEGGTITSSPEFFQSLGMPMKDSGRIYESGAKKGQPILVPDIKSEEDIPPNVMKFFSSCNEWIEQTYGKENVVYSGIHFDEDTPHLQFYVLPVANGRKIKQYEKDENGNRKMKKIKNKDGIEKEVPIYKRDEKGKIIYGFEEGKFLSRNEWNNQRGGKNSFKQTQNNFNLFINQKGFDLNRGKEDSGRTHLSKKQYQAMENFYLDRRIFETEKQKFFNDINTTFDRFREEYIFDNYGCYRDENAEIVDDLLSALQRDMKKLQWDLNHNHVKSAWDEKEWYEYTDYDK